jgi:sugar lactone lactonase YvrE
VELSPSGKQLAATGSAGGASGQFASPTGIALDPRGNLYLADTNNHRILKFALSP